ncbi:WG repeat-containing protein [Algoriphagus namhaensis]
MKKLIWMLLMASLCSNLSAQIQLEGRFDLDNPQNQLWDGRYLVYNFYKDVIIYDTQTETQYKEIGQSLPDMSFKEGLYFRRVDGKYEMRRVGDPNPVLPQRFLRITNWFGNTVLAWEQTAPNLEGMRAYWYELDKGVIATYSLAQLYQAVDYDGTYTHNAMSIFQSKPWESFIYFFHDGLITLKHPTKGTFSYFDLKLNPAFPGKFRKADPFFENLAAVQNANGLWGFIDKSGKEVIPFIYVKRPWPFHSGLARVESKEGYVGFINTQGELVIPAKYPYASSFYKGKSIARNTGFPATFLILDSLGNETPFPCICGPDSGHFITQLYADYFPLNPVVDWVDTGFLPANRKSLSGVFSKEYEEILPFDYALIKDVKNGKAIAIEWGELGSYKNLRFFLMDLETRSPAIELSFTEF